MSIQYQLLGPDRNTMEHINGILSNAAAGKKEVPSTQLHGDIYHCSLAYMETEEQVHL